ARIAAHQVIIGRDGFIPRVTIAAGGAGGVNAPASFRAADLLAVHRHGAPRVAPAARAFAGRWITTILPSHHAIARYRRRAVRMPIEHLAVGGMAFPGRCRLHARTAWRS